MRKTLMAFGVLGVLVLAAVVPMALADGKGSSGDPREARQQKADEMREKAQELREKRAEMERMKHWERGNVTLNLTASGVGKDNSTYTLKLSGDGKDFARVRDNATVAVRGVAMAQVVVTAANGTVLKQVDGRVLFALQEKKDGNWTWMVISVAKRASGAPKLELHGAAGALGAGAFGLESGRGKVVLKLDGSQEALRVKLTSVSGSIGPKA
jgi:hypothetical protein